MPTKTLYTAHAISKGGRSGHVETDDKRLSFDLPPSNSKTGTNPEQLFACGYAACFGSALDAVAKKMEIDIAQATVKIDIDLNQGEHGFFLGATLNISIPGLDNDSAEKLVHSAHQLCPYSKATRGNINVEIKVNDQPLAKAA